MESKTRHISRGVNNWWPSPLKAEEEADLGDHTNDGYLQHHLLCCLCCLFSLCFSISICKMNELAGPFSPFPSPDEVDLVKMCTKSSAPSPEHGAAIRDQMWDTHRKHLPWRHSSDQNPANTHCSSSRLLALLTLRLGQSSVLLGNSSCRPFLSTLWLKLPYCPPLARAISIACTTPHMAPEASSYVPLRNSTVIHQIPSL